MSATTPELIVIGRVLKAHGVRGMLVVESLSDVEGRFEELAGAYLRSGDEQPVWVTVESVAEHSGRLLIKLDGVDRRESAQELAGATLELDRSNTPAPTEDDHYHHQLVGLSVVTEDGALIGTVASILETGANDVLIVTSTEGKEHLIPASQHIVRSIDFAAERIVIDPLPGLLDLADESTEGGG